MPHTVKAIDNELDLIKRELTAMGELTLEMLSSAIEAFSSGSTTQASGIILQDSRVDELQRIIEEKIAIVIARRQPEPGFWREAQRVKRSGFSRLCQARREGLGTGS